MGKSFVASVLTVAGGSAIAQAIALVSFPFITRLYSPDVYGLFVVFLAYGGFVGPIACGRFDAAIALPKSSRGASAVALGSLATAVFAAVLTAASILVFGAGTIGSDRGVALGLALYVLLAGAQQVFTNWCARTRDYARLSAARIVQSIVAALLSIGLARTYDADAGMLVVATLAGQAVGLVVLLTGLHASGFAFDVKARQVLRMLKYFRRIAVFNVPQVVSDAAQASGIPLAIAVLFGSQAAAYYSFSMRLLKAPLNLIGSAISQVYYPRAAAHRNDHSRLRHDALGILKVLGAAACFFQPVLLLIPDSAYRLAFGDSWSGIGSYLRALSPWILTSFVVGPMGVLYLLKGRVALVLVLALGGSVLAFGIFGVAWVTSTTVLATMWALSLGMALYFIASTLLEFVVVIGREKEHA